jgi:hypothetical protein
MLLDISLPEMTIATPRIGWKRSIERRWEWMWSTPMWKWVAVYVGIRTEKEIHPHGQQLLKIETE